MPADRPAEPWFSFLTELDAQLDEPADFHCIGGFVVSQYLGFGRETADLDVLRVIPGQAALRVVEFAARDLPCTRSTGSASTTSESRTTPTTTKAGWSAHFPFGPTSASGLLNRTTSRSRNWSAASNAISATSSSWPKRV
jgi:hypothetical protein